MPQNVAQKRVSGYTIRTYRNLFTDWNGIELPMGGWLGI